MAKKKAGGNYERWSWTDTKWRCANCGCGPELAEHAGRLGDSPHPYNLNQKTCSPSCARQRRTQQMQACRERKKLAQASQR